MYAPKLNRLIHDSYARLSARFGPELQIVADTASVRESIVLETPAPTTWVNPLETAFYGSKARPAIVTHRAAHLYRLSNIYIVGSEALMFSGPHTLLRLDSSQSGIPIHKIRRPIPALARRIDGTVLPLGGRGTGNRGHFLCEHLPRLMLARRHLGADFPLTILLTPGHAPWQREYLTRLGENPANMIEGSRGTIFCADVRFVPNLSDGPIVELYDPAIYREIANRFKAGLPARRGGRRLFISRQDASLRRLGNEPEVFAEFARAFPGLESVAMTGLGLAEQIALFRDAELVVGAHNQAFRNLLYCEGALAIQLVPGTRGAEDEYLPWATNYERLGLLSGNRCLSLYNGAPYRGGDWHFPLPALSAIIEKLRQLPEAAAP